MPALDQIVVVIPAHNELAHLPDCLRVMVTAAMCVPQPVTTVVVLDSCDDDSEQFAGKFGPDVHFVSVDAGNVGAARAAGFEYAKSTCSGIDPARIWYATSDADSNVPADWLLTMTAAESDMVLGVVSVPLWRHFPASVARRYLRAYGPKAKTHNHIHGANMGFRADAYWSVGGFRALETGEDVELVGRFEAAGLRIARDSALSVETSDRLDARAPGGFGAHLRRLAHSAAPGTFGEPA